MIPRIGIITGTAALAAIIGASPADAGKKDDTLNIA